MAEDLIDRLSALVSNPDAIRAHSFELARGLSCLVEEHSSEAGNDRRIQELVLRACEHREAFGEFAPVIDDLLRVRGLFPYLEPEQLGFGESLAYEMHRPYNLRDIILHRVQGEVYRYLLSGENVILSAPTSFGKSLLIDALVATNRFQNVVVVVPTIALIDETRRRLSDRFRGQYKIITHVGQRRHDRNIFVLTQERVVEFPDLGGVDFFVVDEFYKLDPQQGEDRANLLNQAFYRLYSTGAQFYMLGPNIRQLPVDLPDRLRCRFLATDFATVVSEVVRVPNTSVNRLEKLVGLCQELTEPTLVYCASPASARRVAAALEGAATREVNPRLDGAALWAAEHYHPDWTFVRALRRGIGLHHGKVPRALQQYLVRSFNTGLLDVLVCTSTLIEGVNTKAKNVVVYDNKVSTRKFDYSTFNNIKGRSGRMTEHFVGRVFLFNDPPQEALPFVDVPMFTQSERAADSLLIQLDDSYLTPRSRERIGGYALQPYLSIDVIRANAGIDPSAQVELAARIASDARTYQPLLAWNGLPTYEQLVFACELIWQHFFGSVGRRYGVSSGKQLAFRLNAFRKSRSVHSLILRELADQDEPDADRAVEDVLEFVRQWATFEFPRSLMALDRIQRHVFERVRLQAGSYGFYAAAIESMFTTSGLAALDEYGVPIQVAERIANKLGRPVDLDSAIEALRSIDVDGLELSEFERELVEDAKTSL